MIPVMMIGVFLAIIAAIAIMTSVVVGAVIIIVTIIAVIATVITTIMTIMTIILHIPSLPLPPFSRRSSDFSRSRHLFPLIRRNAPVNLHLSSDDHTTNIPAGIKHHIHMQLLATHALSLLQPSDEQLSSDEHHAMQLLNETAASLCLSGRKNDESREDLRNCRNQAISWKSSFPAGNFSGRVYMRW